jgi:hypothetical protein
VGPVFHLRRERTSRGKTTVEDGHGITSLTPRAASAAKRLDRLRSPWAMANQRFGARDGAPGEDASRVRTGAAAQVEAANRDAGSLLLSRGAQRGITHAMRDLRFHPHKAIKLVTN